DLAALAPLRARTGTREVTRAVSRGGAYRQPVRARRKAAVGIDVTSSTPPASTSASRLGRSPRLGPFPGDVRSYVCHHLELRSNRSSVAPASRACRPCSDRLFAVVRHLSSQRRALRL